ncbi:CoA-transferase [Salinicoccus albus]|uniref:CoA-transferase n=1 Tax=Salinicoccus albus TaxID=418756 RepID=UPI0003657FC4|nr:CoA-transferase [Salinicoccus albus]
MALNDIIPEEYKNKIMSPESATRYIESGMTVVTSGFSKVGYPKVVPASLANLGSKGPRDITLVTSGAVGSEMDNWIKNRGISRLSPYQSSKDIRSLINNGELTYSDYHIGRVAEGIDAKQWGAPDIALIEISGITESGGLIPRFSVDNTPDYLKQARKVILELNVGNEEEFHGMRDIIDIPSLGKKDHIPIFSVSDRIGTSEIGVDKNKIVAIVSSDKTDTGYTYTQPDKETISIGTNVSDFLKDIKSDDQISSTQPFQIGVGNLGNFITNRLSETLAPLSLYSEVVHDNVLEGLKKVRSKRLQPAL